MDEGLRLYRAVLRLHHHGPRLATVDAVDVDGNGTQRASPMQQVVL